MPSTVPFFVRHVGVGVHQLGQAEVEQLRGPGAGDHDVGGLEIAVEDAARVGRLQRAGNLDRQA